MEGINLLCSRVLRKNSLGLNSAIQNSSYTKEEMPVYIPEIAHVCCNMPKNAAGIPTCVAKTKKLWSMFTEFSLTKWLTMLHNENYESKEATKFINHNFRYVCKRLI